jgi:Fe-S-cluster containining protein
MDFSYLFDPYDNLVSKADASFQEVKAAFPECVQCAPHCADCCHAVFGLFLIEAAFLKRDFDQLTEDQRESALQRCRDADNSLEKLEERLRSFQDDPQMISYSLARARIRCPLLNEQNECILYPYRPITCRIYGVPTRIRGTPHVCGKSGFEKGKKYPLFDLDETHRELHQLSRELLERSNVTDLERATLLFSVSKVLKTPIEDLLTEIAGEAGEGP